jgi:hypothetical protein
MTLTMSSDEPSRPARSKAASVAAADAVDRSVARRRVPVAAGPSRSGESDPVDVIDP